MPSFLLPWFLVVKQNAVFVLTVVVLLYAFFRKYTYQAAAMRKFPYPPGPKPWPIIGNMFHIARDNESTAYQQLAKEYGALDLLVQSRHLSLW